MHLEILVNGLKSKVRVLSTSEELSKALRLPQVFVLKDSVFNLLKAVPMLGEEKLKVVELFSKNGL